jgi:hypothetical protein
MRAAFGAARRISGSELGNHEVDGISDMLTLTLGNPAFAHALQDMSTSAAACLISGI